MNSHIYHENRNQHPFYTIKILLNFIGKFYFILISETNITNELQNNAE